MIVMKTLACLDCNIPVTSRHGVRKRCGKCKRKNNATTATAKYRRKNQKRLRNIDGCGDLKWLNF